MKSLIETTIGELTTPYGFFYAERYQFNLSADNATTWPIAVLLPIVMEKKSDTAGRIATKHFIQLIFINKTDFLADPETRILPVLEALEDDIDEFIYRFSQSQKWAVPFQDVPVLIAPIPDEFNVPGDGYVVEMEVQPFINKKVCI